MTSVRVLVPLLGIRIAGLLSILLCVFTLELSWINEHRARLLLTTQEEYVLRDHLRLERRDLEQAIHILICHQLELDTQVDIMMGADRSGKRLSYFGEVRGVGSCFE